MPPKLRSKSLNGRHVVQSGDAESVSHLYSASSTDVGAGPSGQQMHAFTGYGLAQARWDSSKDIIHLEKPADYLGFETTFSGYIFEIFN